MCRIIMYISFLGAMPALAAPVRMEFQGEITGHLNDPAIADGIPVGSVFEGHFYYDADIVSQSQHAHGHSNYVCNDAVELVINVNGYSFYSGSVSVSIDHYTDPIQDRIGIIGGEYTQHEGINWGIAFSFSNFSENVLESTELPSNQLDLNDWPGANLYIADQDSQSIFTPELVGRVTSITPEPASLALLAIGGLAVVRRR